MGKHSPSSTQQRHQFTWVSELATKQHGIVARAQLEAGGCTSGTIGRWIEHGYLHRVHSGVYAVGHAAPSRTGYMLAALLSVGEERAAIARRTALEVMGVWRVTSRPVDLVVVGRTRVRSDVNVHHSRLLPEQHIWTPSGIRSTTAARTLMDLALELDAQQLANVIHEMTYRRLYDPQDFARCIKRMHASNGAHVALAAMEMARIGSAGTKSELEQRVRALVLELGLVIPRSNVKIETSVGWFEVDMCWVDEGIYLEVDGPPHARMRTQNRDRDKRIALRHAGWKELRVGYLELDLDRDGVSERLIRELPRA